MLGRDVTSIMRLLPGVRYENTVDSLGMSFGTDVPNVGGARRDWSNVIVDGVVANEVGASQLMAQQINLDAIAEVRVLLNSYRAEYGRAGGGQVQIVSKSGASDVSRQSLLLRPSTKRSTRTTSSTNRAGIKKPRYRFNTFGANLGGPVPETATRSCSSSTRWRRRWSAGRAACATGRCRPTREMRGDFSQTLDAQGRLIFIRDPLRAAAPATRRPAGRRASRATSSRPIGINSNGLALLNMLPRANNFDRTFTQGQFNYTTQENAENPKMNNVVRVDWRPSNTTASTSRSRTGIRTSAAARSPPARPSGGSSTPTT